MNDQLEFPSSLFTQLEVVFLHNVYLGVQVSSMVRLTL
jgi:hypothetical protein